MIPEIPDMMRMYNITGSHRIHIASLTGFRTPYSAPGVTMKIEREVVYIIAGAHIIFNNSYNNVIIVYLTRIHI